MLLVSKRAGATVSERERAIGVCNGVITYAYEIATHFQARAGELAQCDPAAPVDEVGPLALEAVDGLAETLRRSGGTLTAADDALLAPVLAAADRLWPVAEAGETEGGDSLLDVLACRACGFWFDSRDPRADAEDGVCPACVAGIPVAPSGRAAGVGGCA